MCNLYSLTKGPAAIVAVARPCAHDRKPPPAAGHLPGLSRTDRAQHVTARRPAATMQRSGRGSPPCGHGAGR